MNFKYLKLYSKARFTSDFKHTSGMEIMAYNDIQNNALTYVTGVGVDYDVSPTHSFGFQLLNSRTMHYRDKYGDDVSENIQEPDWPVEVVGRWIGKLFDDKLANAV